MLAKQQDLTRKAPASVNFAVLSCVAASVWV